MMLRSKTAIVYGAGPIGSSVARAFAGEGARVFLAGRTTTRLDQAAAAIKADGDHVEIAQVDATDQSAVDAHTSMVVDTTGGIDVVFNATSNDDVQGTALVELAYADFILPVIKAVTTHFVISTATARHMIRRKSGVILVMAGGREAIPDLGGAHVAWAALAGLCRQLAAELGPHGIRVAWMLSPGSPNAGHEGEAYAGGTLLTRLPSYEEVGAVAAFLASDGGRSMTATEVNLTAGAVVD
jgi:NAD(P)-dependent dehydrogenase (short-subunit alcohol dehydrogenase family)